MQTAYVSLVSKNISLRKMNLAKRNLKCACCVFSGASKHRFVYIFETFNIKPVMKLFAIYGNISKDF